MNLSKLLFAITFLLLFSITGVAQNPSQDDKPKTPTFSKERDGEEKDGKKEEEANAVRMLREISNAERAYALKNKDEGFACSLAQLGPSGAGSINAKLATGRVEEYKFAVICPDAPKPNIRVIVQAVPADRGEDQRAFCLDLYFVLGKVTGGIINSAKDGKGETCMTRGTPLR